jgi:hypothetical protein
MFACCVFPAKPEADVFVEVPGDWENRGSRQIYAKEWPKIYYKETPESDFIEIGLRKLNKLLEHVKGEFRIEQDYTNYLHFVRCDALAIVMGLRLKLFLEES